MKARMMLAAGAMLFVVGTSLAAEPTVSWKLLPTPKPAAKARVDAGAIEFQNACAVCHGVGFDKPGTTSLGFKYRGARPALLEERTDLTPELVKYFIRNGIAMMPQFRKTELSDEQVAAIAAYLARKRK
jgi:mono/diheme cytochrome c family protein